MHWFPPPVNYPSQYDPGCGTRHKTTNKYNPALSLSIFYVISKCIIMITLKQSENKRRALGGETSAGSAKYIAHSVCLDIDSIMAKFESVLACNSSDKCHYHPTCCTFGVML